MQIHDAKHFNKFDNLLYGVFFLCYIVNHL